jgi:glyoxylase I family protein
MTGLHHVGLTVSDLDASVAFYQALLDCRLLERSHGSGPELETLTGIAGVQVQTADLAIPGGGIIELVQYLAPAGNQLAQERYQPGHTHVAFVVERIEAAHERLTALGFPPAAPPVTIAEPGSAWDGTRVMYALDPDGRTIECLEHPPRYR